MADGAHSLAGSSEVTVANRTGYYRPPQTLLGGSDDPTQSRYFQQYGLNYDPNYLPITGYQNFNYTDAINQGYSPQMAEAAARGQGIPQYMEAAGPNIEDMANLQRRESQGDGAGLFAMGLASMLTAGGLLAATGGGGAAGVGAAGSGSGAGAGAGAGAAGATAGSAGTAAGAGAAAGGIPAGMEGVTVLGSSGAGAGAGAAGAGAGIGGSAAFWDSVNSGASDTSATNAQNERDLQNMDNPAGTDWMDLVKRGGGLLNSVNNAAGQQPQVDVAGPGFGAGGGGLLGGGAARPQGVANQRSVVRRSPLERYMATTRMGLLGQ
jgi:hypothetical protein